MNTRPESSRRDFLTGRAAQRALRQQGDLLADALSPGTEPRPAPQAQDTVRLETRAMACTWSVIMNPGPPRQVMVASDALDRVHAVEHQLTVYRDDSEMARINRLAAETPQTLPADLFEFITHCRDLWADTAGAFDPAMGALIQLWRSARKSNRVPDQAEVSTALAATGLQHVHLNASQSTIAYDTPGIQLDFGAIGKGYAIDQALAHLLAEGLTDCLIHGGHSSLAAHGAHGGHAGWPVGIKNPLFTEQRYATLLLRDQAMSTSGSNVQFFRHHGKRYGHILDPRTGWPAQGLLSVTVVAPQAADADALSTAFYVMGLDKARRYCDDHPQVGAILIPPPARGRTLEPIVCNLPEEQLFFELPPEHDAQ